MWQVMLEVSLVFSPLLLLLLLLSPRLGRRYAAMARAALWLILAVRLLIPLGITGQRLITVKIPTGASVPTVNGGYIPRFDDQEPALQEGEQSPLLQKNIFSLSLRQVAGAVWTAGMITVLTHHLLAYALTRRRVLRWSTKAADEVLLVLYQRLCREQEVSKPPLLLQVPDQMPMLTGFLRPLIILPQGLSAVQAEAILRHELTHHKRRDLWYKLVLLLAVAVHWFNPLVHWMCRRAELDIEAACDAAVLQGGDTGQRRRYGLAVLQVLERGQERTTLTTGFGGKRRHLLQRFAEISDPTARKMGRWAIALVLSVAIGCGILAGCDTAAASSAASEEDYTPADMHVEVTAQEQAAEDTPELPYHFPNSAYVGLGEMLWPVSGFPGLSAVYGWRHDGQDYHTGIDISGEGMEGQPVIAADDGIVSFVNRQYTEGVGYGIYLLVDHGGDITTLYAHLDAVRVQAGDTVARGQKIGEVGATGYADHPHLHFEVREGGTHVDPLPYITIQEPPAVFLQPVDTTTPPTTYEDHIGQGIDYHSELGGDDVFATADGVVVKAVEGYTGYGHYMIVDHGAGYQSLYAHCSEITVAVGDSVKAGEVIARVGRTGWATGYHLHFEIRLNGEYQNPLDYVALPANE